MRVKAGSHRALPREGSVRSADGVRPAGRKGRIPPHAVCWWSAPCVGKVVYSTHTVCEEEPSEDSARLSGNFMFLQYPTVVGATIVVYMFIRGGLCNTCSQYLFLSFLVDGLTVLYCSSKTRCLVPTVGHSKFLVPVS